MQQTKPDFETKWSLSDSHRGSLACDASGMTATLRDQIDIEPREVASIRKPGCEYRYLSQRASVAQPEANQAKSPHFLGHFELLPLHGKHAAGKLTIVNRGFRQCCNLPWRVTDEGYVRAAQRGRIMLHQLVLLMAGVDRPSAMHVVDHINGDKLDNRIANLRWATSADNSHNIRRLTWKTNCRFKGVHKFRKRYRAMIGLNGKVLHIGMFDSPEEAALAYDAKATELFGQFAATNKDLGLLG